MGFSNSWTDNFRSSGEPLFRWQNSPTDSTSNTTSAWMEQAQRTSGFGIRVGTLCTGPMVCQQPQKIIMTGDTLDDGSLVGRIDGLAVAPSGALAFNVDIDDRGRAPAMYTTATGTRILDPSVLNSFYTIHSINSRSEIVFTGMWAMDGVSSVGMATRPHPCCSGTMLSTAHAFALSATRSSHLRERFTA